MKAAVVVDINKPLEMWELLPHPIEHGQVKVRNLVSGLCGAQLQEIAGHKGNTKFMPHLLGHEGCGIVEEIGDGVTQVKPGDKVIMHWRVSKGIESANPKYSTRIGRVITGGKVTTLSEYSVVSENRLTVVPQDTDPEVAALLGCGLSTAFGTVFREADVNKDESVLITGCGGVGLGVVLGCSLRHAASIVCMDGSQDPAKAEYAKRLGATEYITSMQSCGKADVVIDTTGNPDVIAAGFAALKPSGRMILVAQPAPGQSLVFPNANTFFEGQGKRIMATQGGRTLPWMDLPIYHELCEDNLHKVKQLITHSFALDQINDAVDLLRSGSAGRIMISMGTV
jgi:Zn-dependent alcohol dehydrogenase